MTLSAPVNPLRKQTLLGIAPTMPARSEPPAEAAAAPTAPPSAPAPNETETTAREALSLPATDNPLRKRTLLGIAPTPQPTEAPAVATSATATNFSAASGEIDDSDAPAVPAASAPRVPVAPEALVSEAPLTTDIRTAPARAAAPVAPAHGELDEDVPNLRARRPRWVLALAAVAAAAVAVVALRRGEHSAPSPTPAAARPAEAAKASPPPALAPARPAADEREDTQGSSKDHPAPEPLAQPSASRPSSGSPNAADIAVAAPSAAVAAPASGNAAAASGEVRRILIESDPAGARLFRRGKEVGTTPFTLELEGADKRAYELVLPGYVTRKVVLDGSKSEISIGLRPEPSAFTGTNPRK